MRAITSHFIIMPLAASALAIMTACTGSTTSVEDVKNGNVLTQTPITYSTGGTRVTDNHFDKNDEIAVWSNYSNEETGPLAYISDQHVILGKDATWKAETTYYWPANGTMDFYAVYPVPGSDVNNRITMTPGETPELTYTITDFSKTVDLLAATTPAVVCPAEVAVPLHFRHVLSKLQFNVINNCKYGVPLDIRLDRFTIDAQLYANGTLDWTDMSMKPVGDKVAYHYELSNITIRGNDADNIYNAGTFYCIPGDIDQITVTAHWTTLNSGAVAEEYEAHNVITIEEDLYANQLTTIDLLCRLSNNGTQTGEVDIKK